MTNPGARPEVVGPGAGARDSDPVEPVSDEVPLAGEPDPRLRLSRGVLVSGRYLLTSRLEHAPTRELWQAVDQTLVRDVRMIVIQASDARADRVLEAARRAALVRDQHFLRVFDADRATVADLTRVWRPGEQETRRGQPGSVRGDGDEPGLSAPLVYVVEEWVSAQSLQTLLRRSPLPARQAVVLTLELAEALAAAHAQGMPHGFVSPDRVLVAANGSVRVSGLRSAAVLTARAPATSGSPAAAEQDAADAAADVRSVGGVLYAALTARWPLGGDADSPTESLWRWSPGAAVHADDDAPGAAPMLRPAPRAHGRVLAPRQVRPGVPRRLDELVLRLLGQPVGDHPPVSTPAEAVELLTAHLQPTADRGGALPALRDLADQQGRVPRSPAAARAAATPGGSSASPARAPVADGTAARALDSGVVAGARLPPVERVDHGVFGVSGREVPRRRSVSAPADLRAADDLSVSGDPRGDGDRPAVPRVRSDVPAARSQPAREDAARDGGVRDGELWEAPAVAVAVDDDRPRFLAWQGAEGRIDDDGPTGGLPAPVGRVPGDRRAPDLRLNPAGPPSHRLRPLIVIVIVLALVGAGTALVVFSKKTLSGRGSNPQSIRASSSAPPAGGTSRASAPATAGAAAIVTLPIVGAHDFDPFPGNGSENPGLVGLAIDGSETTAWPTVEYFGRPDLGGLKAGVGLVFDLGTQQRVRRVVVGLTGNGTSLQVLASTAGSRPQLLSGFNLEAQASDQGARATLVMRAPVRARWILVWLTRLPQVAGGAYQGGISFVTIRGQTGT